MFSRIIKIAVVVVALWSALSGLWPAAAQTLTLVDQERSVFAFVIVPQCGGEDSESQAAPGFEPFNALASAALTCEAASGLASAQQRSVLGAERLEARGQSVSHAAAEVHDIIHAIGSSLFEVDFSLDEPARFRLRGLIRSASSADFILGGATVRLTGPDGEIVAEQVIPGPGGEPTTLRIDESGELRSGSYTLLATAESVIDNELPPDRFVLASYRIRFDAAPATD